MFLWAQYLRKVIIAALACTGEVSLDAVKNIAKEAMSMEPPPPISSYVSYEGDRSRSGLRHGRGVCVFANGDRYEGEWRNDRRYGRGVMYYHDGDRYEGEYVMDRRHGNGTYYFANGDRYSGEWLDHDRTGYGVFLGHDGSSYEGNWERNRWEGRGRYKGADGTVYEGMFKAGKKHGQGVDVAPDGSRYDGHWHQGRRHGAGTKTYSNGNTFEGTWDNGQKSSGTMTYARGGYYRGTFDAQGRKSGRAVEEMPTKDRYEGEYLEDRPDGQGTLYRGEGDVVTGMWKAGRYAGPVRPEDTRASSSSTHTASDATHTPRDLTATLGTVDTVARAGSSADDDSMAPSDSASINSRLPHCATTLQMHTLADALEATTVTNAPEDTCKPSQPPRANGTPRRVSPPPPPVEERGDGAVGKGHRQRSSSGSGGVTSSYRRTPSYDQMQDLRCPITKELMNEPVLCVADGYTYEHVAILLWFMRGHSVSPVTGQVLQTRDLAPNLALKRVREAFCKAHPHYAPGRYLSSVEMDALRHAVDMAEARVLRKDYEGDMV